MTNPSAPAEVVQADRDAAAEYALNQLGLKEAADRLRSGGMDDHSTVQAFARHRLNTRPVASTLDAETVDACAERLAEVFGDFAFDDDFGRRQLRTVFDAGDRKLAALRLIEEMPTPLTALIPGKTGSAGVGEGTP